MGYQYHPVHDDGWPRPAGHPSGHDGSVAAGAGQALDTPLGERASERIERCSSATGRGQAP